MTAIVVASSEGVVACSVRAPVLPLTENIDNVRSPRLSAYRWFAGRAMSDRPAATQEAPLHRWPVG